MAKKPEKLSYTLGNVLKARGLQGRLSEYRILGQWGETVGMVIARHARPQSVHGKKLLLLVDSPAWMQQLSLLKPEIIEKINRGLGRKAIVDITLKLADIAPAALPVEVPPVPALLDAEEIEKIEHYVREIQDPEMRAVVKRVIEKDFLSKKRTGEG